MLAKLAEEKNPSLVGAPAVSETEDFDNNFILMVDMDHVLQVGSFPFCLLEFA